MAVHVTIYPEENVAAALRAFMAMHHCSATKAVELMLAHTLATESLTQPTSPTARVPRLAVA